MTNAEQFAKLFRGYTGRYGRYDLAGRKSEKLKEEGQAKTVDKTIKATDYADHVAGKVGIGIIPLCEDNTVHFAAIDVDIYEEGAKAKRNLSHESLAERLADLPVVVSRSKSNGIHIWLFSEEGVPAKSAVRFLQALSAMLGVGGSEIFPKQITRGDQADVGNWINLPYFGAARKAVAVVDGKPTDLSLDQFLALASDSAAFVTKGKLEVITKDISEKPVADITNADLKDGPPCLQRLIFGEPERRTKLRAQFESGEIDRLTFDKEMASTLPLLEDNRNIAFYNVGHYLVRKMKGSQETGKLSKEEVQQLEGKLHEIHTEFVRMTGNDGIGGELRQIAGSVGRGGKGYQCTKEPLCSMCNRDLCRSRRFGVGSSPHDVSLEVGNLTIVDSDPPQYYLTIGEDRIFLEDTNTLLTQRLFKVRYTEQAKKIWNTIPEKIYDTLMSGVFDNHTVIAPLPDSDMVSILLSNLLDFLDDKGKKAGEHDAAIHSGHALIDDDSYAYFTMKSLESYLNAQGAPRQDRSQIARTLKEKFDAQAPTNPKKFDGKSARVYIAHIPTLQRLAERPYE